ncbi:MAG: sugar phosphate isomerase/epimerase [Clostridia bacterium]|nr:sugar phosphate isomerase/epimerase [Clostridia bacterium]
MRVGTSTNLLFYLHSEPTVPAEECLKLCSEHGFRVFDINCCEYADPGCPLTRDDWMDWAARLRETADRLGVVFSQSHNPIYNVCMPDSVPDWDLQEELTRRSVVCAGILGVRWIVVHAGTAMQNGVYDREKTIEKNIAYFRPMIQKANLVGCEGIAIENMAYLPPQTPQIAATTEGLIALVDSFADPAVGVCWDFGHANLTREDQAESLRRIGSRLKATHVADNCGERDDHTLPYLGRIGWNSIMPTLGKIGYSGDLVYEIHKYMRWTPRPLHPRMIQHAFEVISYLANLAQGE